MTVIHDIFVTQCQNCEIFFFFFFLIITEIKMRNIKAKRLAHCF